MFWFLIVLIVIDALLLSVTVLLQSGKGGGLAGVAAGGQTQQILGARQAPDFLEKASWTLGGLFIFLSLIASFFAGGSRTSVLQSREASAPPPQAAPLGPLPTAPEGAAPAPATPAPAEGVAPAPAE
jgi:preprotein translocase subunit SecG